MMSFEEMFDKFLTSKNEHEYVQDPEQNLYDKFYLSITKNEDKGTAFFQQFLPQAVLYNENPPYAVSAYKTIHLLEEPGILRKE